MYSKINMCHMLEQDNNIGKITFKKNKDIMGLLQILTHNYSYRNLVMSFSLTVCSRNESH